MTTPTTDFLERTTMRALLGIPTPVLDQAMAVAYQCYRAARWPEAEILCKGLLAADHRYWWAHSLYAAVLRNQGRLEEALAALDSGLRYEPGHPKLVAMKRQVTEALLAVQPDNVRTTALREAA